MIILASQSPRRAELLRQVGIAFETRPASVDERPREGESAAAYVERIARAKAAAGADGGRPVLGADTAVVCADRIMGKPADRGQAVEMLLALSGREHQVLTGIALSAGVTTYRLSRSRVWFRDIERAEAEAYWATGEPRDKAGGYAIQGVAAAFVIRIEGSYSGIMGLPLYETVEMLRAAGIRWGLGV